MLHSPRKWIAPILAALAVIAVQVPSARAAFVIALQEDNGPILTIVSGLPPDTSLDPTKISPDVNAVNAQLQYFRFASLSATSNSTIGGGNDEASLTQGGELGRKTGTGGTHTLTITSSDQFNFPTNPNTMHWTASDSYNQFIVAGGLRTFQSIFDATAAGGTTVTDPDPALQLVPNYGHVGSDSVSSSIGLGSQPTPYTLTNITTITLGPDPGLNKQDYTFGGISSVTGAVPEPTSLSLGLISLPALLALGRRMRRKNDA